MNLTPVRWGTAARWATIAVPVAGLAGPAGAVEVAVVPSARSAAPPVLSRIEFVVASAAPARRPDQGLLVLDLESLESAEAALTMAQHWRHRLDAGRPLVCWLRAPQRHAAAEAIAVLTRAESPPCGRILVPR